MNVAIRSEFDRNIAIDLVELLGFPPTAMSKRKERISQVWRSTAKIPTERNLVRHHLHLCREELSSSLNARMKTTSFAFCYVQSHPRRLSNSAFLHERRTSEKNKNSSVMLDQSSERKGNVFCSSKIWPLPVMECVFLVLCDAISFLCCSHHLEQRIGSILAKQFIVDPIKSRRFSVSYWIEGGLVEKTKKQCLFNRPKWNPKIQDSYKSRLPRRAETSVEDFIEIYLQEFL